MRASVVVSAVLACALGGCTRGPSGTAGAPASATAAATIPATANVPANAPASAVARVPSFQKELGPYFAARCANAPGCHGPRRKRSVKMDLRATESYRALVDVESTERHGAMLVKPGDPEASFLLAKLLGKLRDREGTAMPRDEEDDRPVSPIPFDPDFIDNALVPWIRAGAPNN